MDLELHQLDLSVLMVARIRADPVKDASEPQMSSPSSDPS
jgi:hypothetical protein